jgi:tellurite resistance protein TerC
MTVVLIGVAMIVLPGPAIVVIPAGLAILATEFAWARRWLRIIRKSAEHGAEKLNLRSIFSRNRK